MTMDDSVKEIEFISRKLHKDHEIVNYTQVAKEFAVPFPRAQALLYNFFKANKHQLNGSFIIIGIKHGQKQVKWVELESLMDTELDTFEEVLSVNIYAVSLNTFSYSVQDLVNGQLKLPIDHEKLLYYHKLGMIKGPPLERDQNPSATAPKPDVKTESRSKQDKPEPKPEPKKQSNGLLSLLSHYVSRKQKPEKNKDQKRPAPSAPKYEYKSRKLENTRDKVVVADKGDDFDDDMDLDPPKKDYKTNLNSMFEDDSDEDVIEHGEGDGEEKEPIITEDDPMDIDKQESEQEPEQEPEHEKSEVEPESASEMEQPEQPEQPAEPEYDEDGYLITRAPKPKPKPKAKPNTKAKQSNESESSKQPTKPTGALNSKSKASDAKSSSKSGKKQTSLMNFFGKKK